MLALIKVEKKLDETYKTGKAADVKGNTVNMNLMKCNIVLSIVFTTWKIVILCNNITVIT